MSIIERWRDEAARRPARIVLADAGDRRAVEAAEILNRQAIAETVVVGADPRALVSAPMRLLANSLHAPIDLDDPLDVANLMVAAGEADGCVAGATRPTADVIRSGLRILGTAPATRTVSSSFILVFPDHNTAFDDGRRHLAYGDCGVIPEPDADQLADIAVASAETFTTLTGEDPRVAMLSFSTKGSADHPSIDKVRQATDRVRALAPDLHVDGELQFDAAWDVMVGSGKAPGSSVAGRANVFIFPDLNSGNIAYKITERLAGAQAFGPLLQGLDGVLHDLSRGCSTADVVNVATIAAVQAASEAPTPVGNTAPTGWTTPPG